VSAKDEELVARLLAKLAQTQSEVPTGLFARARRSATAALRAGTGALLTRSVNAEQLAVSLGELKGIAMKLGQILSYLDTPLPEETRKVLAVLQRQSQPTAFEKIEATLREDFGPRAEALLSRLDRVPVATASIGQVHRATLPGGEAVAVKVLQPGVEQALQTDFRAASTAKLMARVIMPGADIEPVLDEAREAFLGECDYEAERRWQERFAQLYAGHATLSIPRVYGEWCSKRVLTTQWIDGLRFDDFAQRADQAARDRAGQALYEFYVGSVYRYGLFNADPHPGNLVFHEDGRLTVLDFGCVRVFDDELRRGLHALSKSVRDDDAAAMKAALVVLGGAKPDEKSWPHTRAMLRGFFGPVLQPGSRRVESGFNADLRTILVDKRAVIRMRLPGKLLFLFRIRFGLHSELAKLRSVADWAALERRLSSSGADETDDARPSAPPSPSPRPT
jgi:predicted unusual protein kinase regulating ubiquinone biosynthesis (AarF/ABC1/UbiB family)